METTRADIVHWLAIGNKENHSHMIVLTDTYDYEDYPTFVEHGTNIHSELEKLGGWNMVKVTEVYSYGQPLEPQIAEHRAWNL